MQLRCDGREALQLCRHVYSCVTLARGWYLIACVQNFNIVQCCNERAKQSELSASNKCYLQSPMCKTPIFAYSHVDVTPHQSDRRYGCEFM